MWINSFPFRWSSSESLTEHSPPSTFCIVNHPGIRRVSFRIFSTYYCIVSVPVANFSIRPEFTAAVHLCRRCSDDHYEVALTPFDLQPYLWSNTHKRASRRGLTRCLRRSPAVSHRESMPSQTIWLGHALVALDVAWAPPVSVCG
jgi:hypothetical protein